MEKMSADNLQAAEHRHVMVPSKQVKGCQDFQDGLNVVEKFRSYIGYILALEVGKKNQFA